MISTTTYRCENFSFNLTSQLNELFPVSQKAKHSEWRHLLSVHQLTGSHLKVHHNPAEDRRLRSQRWLLLTRYVWMTRIKIILVSNLPRWMRVYTVSQWLCAFFFFFFWYQWIDIYMFFIYFVIPSILQKLWLEIKHFLHHVFKHLLNLNNGPYLQAGATSACLFWLLVVLLFLLPFCQPRLCL